MITRRISNIYFRVVFYFYFSFASYFPVISRANSIIRVEKKKEKKKLKRFRVFFWLFQRELIQGRIRFLFNFIIKKKKKANAFFCFFFFLSIQNHIKWIFELISKEFELLSYPFRKSLSISLSLPPLLSAHWLPFASNFFRGKVRL